MQNAARTERPTRRSTVSRAETHEFVWAGQSYRWTERPTEDELRQLPGLADDGAVEALETFRERTAMLEGSGARGLVHAAQTESHGAEARWVHWRAAGIPGDVWGLFVASGGVGANDSFALIAWGERDTLRWAARDHGARRIVLTALHAPPAWLGRGLRSADSSLAVRIERVAAVPAPQRRPAPMAVVRPRIERASETAPADVLLDIVRAWRREHATIDSRRKAG